MRGETFLSAGERVNGAGEEGRVSSGRVGRTGRCPGRRTGPRAGQAGAGSQARAAWTRAVTPVARVGSTTGAKRGEWYWKTQGGHEHPGPGDHPGDERARDARLLGEPPGQGEHTGADHGADDHGDQAGQRRLGRSGRGTPGLRSCGTHGLPLQGSSGAGMVTSGPHATTTRGGARVPERGRGPAAKHGSPRTRSRATSGPPGSSRSPARRYSGGASRWQATGTRIHSTPAERPTASRRVHDQQHGSALCLIRHVLGALVPLVGPPPARKGDRRPRPTGPDRRLDPAPRSVEDRLS